MTADDIIEANPEYRYEPAEIGGMTGLKGTAPDGVEYWCVFSGQSHVAAPGPWTDEEIKADPGGKLPKKAKKK